MTFTAGQIAQLLQGTLVGQAEVEVNGISKIDQSTSNTLCFLANQKYEVYVKDCKATIMLIPEDYQIPSDCQVPAFIRLKDPYSAFTQLLEMYAGFMSKRPAGIHPTAIIGENVTLGDQVSIGPHVVIESGAHVGAGSVLYPNVYIGREAMIGEQCTLYQNVSVYYQCKIGNRCMLHAGVVIGSDGFGHAPQPDGSYRKIPQLGNVEIGNDVEIGANSTIDRATIGSTIIGHGVRLDNLVQVGHNAEIGDHTVIAAQTGLSGSTRLGKNCMIGGQVGFVGHITVADRSRIGAQSGIMKDITESGKDWIGSPIYPIKDSFRMQAVYRNLPTLQERINFLEKELKKLQNPPNTD